MDQTTMPAFSDTCLEMPNTGLCAAHAIHVVLRDVGQDVGFREVVSELRKQSARMLRASGLSEELAGVTVRDTFNVEALSLTLKVFGLKTSWWRGSPSSSTRRLIVGDGHHWLAVIIGNSRARVYSDRHKLLARMPTSDIFEELTRRGYTSGLTIA